MVLYLSVIFVAMVIVATLNILFNLSLFGGAWWLPILFVVLSTVYQFVTDGIIAWLWNKTPNKWYTKEKRVVSPAEWQIKFFEKIKIRKWKDKVWELGGLGGFSKAKLDSPNDPEYINRFIIESGKGIVEHYIGAFFGFTCVFILPLKYALFIGLPVAFVNFVLNILPIWVLKYNLPKLKVVLKRAERIKAREEAKKQEEISAKTEEKSLSETTQKEED